MTFLVVAAVAGRYFHAKYFDSVDPHVVYFLSLFRLLHPSSFEETAAAPGSFAQHGHFFSPGN